APRRLPRGRSATRVESHKTVGRTGRVRTEPTIEVDASSRLLWERLGADNTSPGAGVGLGGGGRLVELAKIPGGSKRPNLTLGQSKWLARRAEAHGFHVEPDPRITGRAYAPEALVALFRSASHPLPTSGYLAAASILELAMAVAAADGHISDSEYAHM